MPNLQKGRSSSSMFFSRNSTLLLSDEDLLADCRVDCFRGSGRGGQKRNVTDSAVRVTHLPSGCSASSDETRSQAQNRKAALALLRRHIALECRCGSISSSWTAEPVPGRRTSAYAVWMAVVLDVLALENYAVGPAAERLQLSTGRLVRLLAGDLQLWQVVNREREGRGLKRLRKS
jgi:hypothetical protein